MEAFEALSLCAEIAIAITGFSGVVLVFGDRREGARSPLDRILFRTLFTATLIPLGLVAIAFILDAAGVAPPTTWQTCSSAQVLAVSITTFLSARGTARIRSEEPNAQVERSAFVTRGGGVVLLVGLLVLCLQLANAISMQVFWPVLVAVWWGLAVGLFAFVSLLFVARAA